MPRTKISEFSVTPGDNTDIDGINIAEGCAPSGINDAIRELMAQLKDFQSGAAGDSITVVGTLAAKGTSSSGADLKLYEDTDNGTNYVGFIAPASIASNVQWTLPSADGSSGQALQTNGSGTLSFATLGISAGGTGQTTANAAFNALAPSQTSNAGRYLKTDGTNTSWDLLDISTADITGTLPVANGGTGITSFGTGVATALGINVGSSGAFVTNGGALGTPSSGTVTNLTGTASININGTVGATTPTTGAFTTLSASGNITVSGGTANGVAYLNGSKVLTTGSALTFDGTNLGVGALNTNALLTLNGDKTALRVERGSAVGFAYNTGTSATDSFRIQSNAGPVDIYTASGQPITFSAGASEQMRLTSTGLGIGTSSPSQKLTVVNNVGIVGANSDTLTSGAYLYLRGDSGLGSGQGTIAQINANYGLDLWGYNGGWQKNLTLTSSGNLGLGVAPSAWNSAYKAIQVGTSASIWGASNAAYLALNAYQDGTGTNRYLNSNFAVLYGSDGNGGFQWRTAPSGNAGNAISFTQALTLNANGALVLQGGNTSASGVGVAFPATQSASSDANTLDDYEQGTWTPGIDFSGSSTGITYTRQVGRYTKIGNMVYVSGSILLSNKGSSSGNARISGLPFAPGGAISTLYPCVTVNVFGLDTTRQIALQVNYSDGGFPIELKIAGTDTNLTNSEVTNTTDIRFMFFYQAAD